MNNMNNEETNFTFKEIDHLIARGYLGLDSQNTFGIKYASKTTNQGFGWHSISKEPGGEIHTSSHYPTNVDPDDGSCDMKHDKEKYRSFDDYLKGEPYYTNKRNTY
jgi:hypothetical protein